MSGENSEPEIPDTGAVFTYGRSRFANNTPSKFWIKRDRVVALNCGDEHTAVVTQSGRLFTFGANDWGQLGLGTSSPASIPKPSCVKTLKANGGVRLAACGKAHTLAVAVAGGVYAFGSNADGQLGKGRKIEMSPKPIKIESILFSLALLSTGKLLVWGSNTEGQLGLGPDSEETIFVPTMLDFDGGKIVDITCGLEIVKSSVMMELDAINLEIKQVLLRGLLSSYYHSAFVTFDGFLYTFGDADGGKLGLGEDVANEDGNTVDEPTKVEMREKISQVSCGGSHTVALSQNGRAYTFGSSANGQLGLGVRTRHAYAPAAITALANVSLVSVTCGENHTAAVSGAGQLFAFGDGRHGKLCLDTETLTNRHAPAVCPSFRGLKVERVACGGCHTMVLAVPIPGYDQQAASATVTAAAGSSEELATSEGWAEDEPLSKLLLLTNGTPLDESINLDARVRRRQLKETTATEQSLLPPIRERHKMPSDPEEIVNIGTEIFRVNGDGEEEKQEKEPDADDEKEDSNGDDDEEEDLPPIMEEHEEENDEDEDGEDEKNKKEEQPEIKKEDKKSMFSFLRGFGRSKQESKEEVSDSRKVDDPEGEATEAADGDNEVEEREKVKSGKRVHFGAKKDTNVEVEEETIQDLEEEQSDEDEQPEESAEDENESEDDKETLPVEEKKDSAKPTVKKRSRACEIL